MAENRPVLVPYANSFAMTLTEELKGTLVTGDPEFETVEDLRVLWLPE